MPTLPFRHSHAPPRLRHWLRTALCAGALLASGCDKTPGLPSPSAPPVPKAEAEAPIAHTTTAAQGRTRSGRTPTPTA